MPDNKRGGKKTALITGTTSGIGYELSRIFTEHGFNLVLVSRSEQKLKTQAAALSSGGGVSVYPVVKDLSEPCAADEVFSEVLRQGLHIDILVNNAGLNESGPFSETDIKKELKMLQVHIISLTHLTKLFLPGMITKGFGRILNVGSTGSFAPCPIDAVYCASKAYVLSFSNAIRAELSGTGVTVSTLCPGATNTEFARKANMEKTLLFKKFVMEPKQVAEIAYRGLMKNKKIIIPGFLNRLMVSSFPLTPDRMLDRMSIALLKRN